MAENQEQTVVTEPDVQPEAGSEGTDAQTDGPDELDKLLAQYEQEASAPEPSLTPGQGEAPDPNLAKKVDALEETLTRVLTKDDMKSTVDAIRGDLDPEVFDDDFMESWLNTQAGKDPRLAKAWVDRHENPKQFDKVKSELGRNFSKKFESLPSKEVTEDREAVAAAVRGASTKAPDGKAPEYGGLSNTEYADKVEKEHGFRPI